MELPITDIASVLSLIPQRSPIVMVDALWEYTPTTGKVLRKRTYRAYCPKHRIAQGVLSLFAAKTSPNGLYRSHKAYQYISLAYSG